MRVIVLALVLASTIRIPAEEVGYRSPSDFPERVDINGGLPTTSSRFPFVVRITSWSGSCGGVLIHPQWVITAGHCMESVDDPAGIRVSRGGVVAPEVRVVEAVYVHPGYASTRLGPVDDLALIRLYRPFFDQGLRTVRMTSGALAEYAAPGSRLVVVGDAGIETDLRYREAELSECPDEVPADAVLLCMATPGEPVGQLGDSGGPALLRIDLQDTEPLESSRYVLMGIMSAGTTIGETGWTRYTPVQPHKEWIYAVLGSALPAVGTEPVTVAACDIEPASLPEPQGGDVAPDLQLRVPELCVPMGDGGVGAILKYAPDPAARVFEWWWFGDMSVAHPELLGFKATLPDGSVWHASQVESRGSYRWTSKRLAEDATAPYDVWQDVGIISCDRSWHECLSEDTDYAYQDLRSRSDLACDPETFSVIP